METLFLIVLCIFVLALLWFKHIKEGFEDLPTYDSNNLFNTIFDSLSAEAPKPPVDVPGATYSSDDIFNKASANLPSMFAQPPADVPGATTNDPTQSIGQPKDIIATMNSFENMQRAVGGADTSNVRPPSEIAAKLRSLPQDAITMNLKKALNNQTIIPVSKLASDRETYDQIHAAYANLPKKITYEDASSTSVASAMTYLPMPTLVATPPGTITLDQLNDLSDRIQAEITRIQNLRSSSATLQAKQSQLEQLQADLNGIIESVRRGKMQLQDVPISSSDAVAFLQTLPNDTLTSLIKPKGTSQVHPMVSFADDSVKKYIGENPDVSALLENAKYLKWSAHLNFEFDPSSAQNDQYLKRLENMETRLTNLVLSETPIPKKLYDVYLDELKTIRQMISKKMTHSPDMNISLKQPLSTPDYPSSYKLDMAKPSSQQHDMAKPSSQQHDMAQPSSRQVGMTQSANQSGTSNRSCPDIQARASAASFNSSTVGGLDYKNRVKSLCGQIVSASLGKPEDFGCITDQNSVSDTYSWKGNYMMVCSRLGNIWGGWYPEMFGCPKNL